MQDPLLSIGYCLGHAICLLSLLAAMGKCLESAEMRRANSRSFRGLALVLFGWLILVAASLARPFFEFPDYPTMLWIGLGILVAALSAGVTLAIIGLLQSLWIDRGVYRSGTWQAAFGLLLGAAQAGLVVVLWLGLLNPWLIAEPNSPPKPAALAQPPVQPKPEPDGPAAKPQKHELLLKIDPDKLAAQVTDAIHWATSDQRSSLTFPDLNFSYHVPPHPWVAIQPAFSTRMPEVRYVRRDANLEFAIFADIPGLEKQIDTRLAAEALKAELRALSGHVWILGERNAVVNRRNGIRIDSSLTVKGTKLTQAQWVFSHGGFTYLLQLRGPAADHGLVLAEAKQLFAGFQLLDASAAMHTSTALARQECALPEFGFEVKLKATAWTPWRKVSTVVPAAQYGAAHPSGAALIIVAMDLDGRKPNLDALVCGLLSVAGLPFESLPLGRRRTLDFGAWSGIQCRFERTDHGADLAYLARVVTGHDRACLVLAYGQPSAGVTEQLLDGAVDSVKFTAVKPHSSDHPVTQAQVEGQAAFFLEVAEYYYRAAQFESSEDFYRLALDLRPQSPVAVLHLVDAYSRRHDYKQALATLDRYAFVIADKADLRARRAQLQAQLDRPADELAE